VTRAHDELLPGVRSFHVRHAKRMKRSLSVKSPVHMVYYRVIRPGLIEVIGVLHERMEPSRHLDMNPKDME